MATLPKVLISRADYQIGGGVALGLRTQAPRNTDAFYHRGLAHRVKGEIDQAIVDFTNAIDGFVGCAVRRHDRAASLMSPALPS